jgi:hypothetical protein
MFAYALYRMARHNNQETEPQKHRIMKVFAGLFGLFAILSIIVFIVCLHTVTFPHVMLEPYNTPFTNPKPADVHLIWGRPTDTQNMLLTSLNVTFLMLGVASYLFFFKESHSKWYTIIGKFVLGFFMYGCYGAATNFNYFDLGEFLGLIIFIVIWSLIILRCQRKNANQ